MANFSGTNADEIIIPSFVSPSVTAAGGTTPSNAADTIDGGGGNDTIDGGGGNDVINGGDGNDLLIGGAGNDTITGGRGNDTALLGSGNDTFIWNPGDGSDTVEGGARTDTLQFNGSNISEHIDISANGSRATLFRDVGAVTMDLNGVEKIALKTLGGADTITVNDLTGTDVKQIAVDLAAAGGLGDGQADTVIVNGTAGNDHINIATSGTSVVVTGLAAKLTIDGAEAANDFLAIQSLGGNDTINASALNPGQIKLFIDGGAGDDTIRGSNGGDIILGGDGNDKITGGAGDDHISGNAGDDVINGGGGNDVIDGGDGNDIIKTGDGVDFLQGGAGDDNIQSGGGNDTIEAGDGNDVVVGGAGNDTVSLGNGDDLFTWNPGDGSDVVDGGAGTDTLAFNGSGDNETITVVANGTHVALTRDIGSVVMDISGIENIFINAGAGDDAIIAGNGLAALTSLTIDGGAGNDRIIGGDGADLILGGSGDDTVTGGRGNDTAFLGSGNDRFIWNPGDGSDIVEGQGGFDTLTFNGANISEHIDISANGDRVRFTRDVANITMDLNGIERIEFAALGGADTITVGDLTGTGVKQVALNLASNAGTGDGAADTVIVTGTAGNNHITVADDGTTVTVSGLPAQVTIAGAEAGLDTLVIDGLDGNDTIDASALASMNLTVDGGAGNDTITGGRGADTLIGGDGNDTVTGGAGNDVALLGAGDDRFIWNPGDGSDIVEGQAGFDTVTFNGSNASEIMDISANGGRVRLFRDVGNVVMDLNGIERIEVATSGGADTVTVNDLTGTGVTQVAIDLAAAGTTMADGQADKVNVNGTAGSDVIFVTRENGAVTVSGLAETVSITHIDAGLDQLTVSGGSGDDVIDASALAANKIGLVLNGGAGNDVIIGSQGSDFVSGGTGNDVAVLGAGDDQFVWNPGDGSDTVNGGTGFDTLTFHGANISENIAIAANGAETLLTRDVAAITMHLTSMERIEVATGGGTDNITVGDLSGTGVKQVAIDLAAFGTTNGDGQADNVTVNGTAGNDIITVTSSGSLLTINGLPEQVTVDHGEAIDHLTISAGGGNNTIDTSAVPAGAMGLTLNGGDGNDTFKLGGGTVFVNSGAGSDSFVFTAGNTGNIVIQDFQVHSGGLHQADTVVLQGFSDHSFDAAVANGHIFQSGADVIIADGTHAFAALQNVSLALLHANDFLFA